MNALGYGVQLLDKEKCCGVALDLERALQAGAASGRDEPAVDPHVGEGPRPGPDHTSSTCTFTLRDEYPHLLGLENGDVRDRIELATRYLYRLIQSGKARLKFKETAPAARRPTTRRATWRRWAGATIRSSCCGSIPGVEVTVLDSPVLAASGGTYGFKKENYGVSQAIGAPLFRQIEESGADIVATDLRDLQMADRDVDLEALRTPAAHLGFATGVAGPFRGTESDLPCLPKNLLDELKNRGLADDALQHQHAGVGTRNCRPLRLLIRAEGVKCEKPEGTRPSGFFVGCAIFGRCVEWEMADRNFLFSIFNFPLSGPVRPRRGPRHRPPGSTAVPAATQPGDRPFSRLRRCSRFRCRPTWQRE